MIGIAAEDVRTRRASPSETRVRLCDRHFSLLHCEIHQTPPYLGVGICVSRLRQPAGGAGATQPRISAVPKEGLPVLMIRLSRVGARKQPHYRVVVIEKDRARNGRSVEVVGTYNPRTNPASLELKRDRIDYWISKGAQLSDRMEKLVAVKPASEATAAA